MKRSVYAIMFLAGLGLAPLQSQVYETYVTETNVTYVFYDQIAPWPGHPEMVMDPDYLCDIGDKDTEQKWTQSFVPFGPIDFIDLMLIGPSGGRTATMYIVLRSNSIDGPVLASTDPITIASGYRNERGEWTRFIFPSTPYTPPWQTYYFQPVVTPGSGRVTVLAGLSRNTAGVLYYGTTPRLAVDIYFREGWIEVYPIPEPSTAALALCGVFVLGWTLRRRCTPFGSQPGNLTAMTLRLSGS